MPALISMDPAELAQRPGLWSATCGWQDLCTSWDPGPSRTGLHQPEGWTRRWTATWKFGKTPVVCPVRDLSSMVADGSVPVRRFAWRTGQKHRPGLQYLFRTDRHHGFESLAERDLLLALDFAAAPAEVLSQPFTLQFTTAAGGFLRHIPDYLVLTPSGTWLIDVRPGHLLTRDTDKLKFAASAEAALACGWGYKVVTGWHQHVQDGLDAMSSQRREVTDHLGMQDQLLQALESGPFGFGDLAETTTCPPVARAHLLHLLWHRRVGLDLAQPLFHDVEPAIVRRRPPTMAEAGLTVAEGAFLVLDGTEWRVDTLEPHLGRVVLARPGADPMDTTLRTLMNHPDCTVSTRSRPGLSAANRNRQPKAAYDLDKEERKIAERRMRHLLEVETGFRGGDRHNPGPGEPRPGYDPDTTNVTQRRRTKAAEMKEFAKREPEDAKALGVDRMSVHTLLRRAKALWEDHMGLMSCADEGWLREAGGHRIGPEVTEALHAVQKECLHRSTLPMTDKVNMIHQFVRERYGEEVEVPGYHTLLKVWKEWFPGGEAKQKYVRSAAIANEVATTEHVIIHRPGQIVALDTTPLPVKLLGSVFGDPVSVSLTLALEVCSRSMVAFRVSMTDNATDIAMLLRDVMAPLPMRPGWGPELAWPYPGIPEHLVAEFAGHPVAALPFVRPETVTTDHGGPYKSRHLVRVQRTLGINILPSRVMRPTDKQAVERAFDSAKTMLFALLPGYTGSDTSERGADPEGDARMTIAEFEHTIATWVVEVWQNHALGDYAPEWDVAGTHSPNTLFAASLAQGGFAMQIPNPELFYSELPEHTVGIDPRRGAKILGLYYHGAILEQERFAGPSTRGGKHKHKWIFHSDPRDRRYVFFQDDLTHQWFPLRWTGMSADDSVPVFGDARVEELLKAATEAGLKPKSDLELMPILLRILGAVIPVDQWATQMTKKERAAHARDAAAGAAGAGDRPTAITTAGAAAGRGAEVVPIRAREVGDAVTDERRRRREAAVPQRLAAPATLGESVQDRALFALFSEQDGDWSDGERESQ